VTNRHVTPAAAKFYGVGWRLVKQAGKSNPIDAGIALAMALRVLSHQKEKPTSEDGLVVDSSLYLARPYLGCPVAGRL